MKKPCTFIRLILLFALFVIPNLLLANGEPTGNPLNGTPGNPDSLAVRLGHCDPVIVPVINCATGTIELGAFILWTFTGVYEPYYASWSNGESGHKITVVPPGIWSWDASDTGCEPIHWPNEYVQSGTFFNGTLNITGAPICAGSSTLLYVTTGLTPEYYFQTYSWSPVNPTNILTPYEVFHPGTFVLNVQDDLGCPFSDQYFVPLSPVVNPTISGPPYLCPGDDTAFIQVNQTWSAYEWQDGSTTNPITITEPGLYQVTVTNQFGCTGVGYVGVLQGELGSSEPTFLMTSLVNNLVFCSGEDAIITTYLSSICGFSSPVALSITGAPSGATVDISPDPVIPTGDATITLSGFTAGMIGNYTLTVTGEGGGITRTATVTLSVLPPIPGVPAAISPVDGATGVSTTTLLSWTAVAAASTYMLEVATNPSFSVGSIVWSQTVSVPNTTVSGLQDETVYYWRVLAKNSCGMSDYSTTYAFQTGRLLCDFEPCIITFVEIDSNSVNTVQLSVNMPIDRIITDVDVNFNINHTWVGDLSARLISPHNDDILLFDRPGVPVSQYGCDGDNANLTFDSQAALSAAALENQCNISPPALSGTFRPVESLNVLNGKMSKGTWTLLVTDNWPKDGGGLDQFCVSFCLEPQIPSGSILTNIPLTVNSGSSGTIDMSKLRMETSGSALQGQFIVLSLPLHGTLKLNNIVLGVGGIFTQADINNGNLIYTNNGDGALTDNFHFDALDLNNDFWVHNAVFNININPAPLTASASQTNGILCHNGTTGQITVTATGLNGIYTYSLNGGPNQNSNVFSGLSAGTYTVVVTGQFGSTMSTTIMLVNPPAISVSASVASDDVTVNTSGGTGVLTYSINGVDFQSSNQFTNLPCGTYTITVRDANGCTETSQASVNVLSGSFQTPAPILCFGDSTTIIMIASCGNAPYQYRLDNGPLQSDSIFSDIKAGTYSGTIIDASGATIVLGPIVISQPSQLSVAASLNCNDATLTYTGGTPTYTFVSDAPNPDLQDLPNGTYHVTATDGNGCTATTAFDVNVLPLGVSSITDSVLCFGGNTGSIVATGIGGCLPYTYSLGGSPFLPANSFPNLAAGTYALAVKDDKGNLSSVFVTVFQPALLGLAATVNGNTVTANASGGTSPYTYTLNGGTSQTNGVFSNLTNGTYTVVSTDANGCTASMTNLVVMVNGTIEPTETWGLTVSPNPSTGLFVLKLQNAPDVLRAEMFDVTGRLLQSLMFQPSGGQFSTSLDLHSFPQGTYLLRLSDGKNWGGVRLCKVN